MQLNQSQKKSNNINQDQQNQTIKLEVIKTKELYSADKTFLTLTFNFKAGEKKHL